MNAPRKVRAPFGVPQKLMEMEIITVMKTLDGAAPPVQQLRKRRTSMMVATSASFLSSTMVLSTMNAPWMERIPFGVPLKLMTTGCTMAMKTLDGAAPPVQQLRQKGTFNMSVATSASFLSSTMVSSTMNAHWKEKIPFGVPLELMTMENTTVMKTLDGAAQLAAQQKEQKFIKVANLTNLTTVQVPTATITSMSIGVTVCQDTPWTKRMTTHVNVLKVKAKQMK